MGLFDIFKNKKNGNQISDSDRSVNSHEDEVRDVVSKYFKPQEKKIDNILLCREIQSCCENTGARLEGGRVYFPEWNMYVRPEIMDLKSNMATVGYYLESADWDREIFECCSGLGQDTKTALGMAQGSFLFGILEALRMSAEGQTSEILESSFNGHTHSWDVSIGNIVGMGKTPDQGADVYWKVLREGIIKRLGNQKICYVKVYAADIGNGNIEGECRINNIVSEELSDIIRSMVRKWHNSEFGSQKQFFILRQDKETMLPYPYTEKDIITKTETAMVLFEKCLYDGQPFEQYSDSLNEVIGDSSLAYDLLHFIPEICAENAIPEPKYQETVTLLKDDRQYEIYRSQLASFYPISSGVFAALDKGVLRDANKVYKEYILRSSVCHALNGALSNGAKPEDLVMASLIFNVGEDYEIR